MAKPSKTAKTERQRLIEETLKKQRSSEKRRGNVIIIAAVVLALAILSLVLVPVFLGKLEESKYGDDPIAEIGAPASACREVETRDASGVSNHVPEPQEVDYEESPPAFGPHWSTEDAPAPFEDKFYDDQDRPAVEALVHNLEHGYTILWYDQSIADDTEQLAQVRAIAKKFDESGDNLNFRNKFIAAPWLTSDDDGDNTFPEGQHVAFTHWSGDSTTSTGVWQYCTDVSGAALETFLDEYPYTDSPEATIP